MFNLATKAAIAATADFSLIDKADVPKKYHWALDCDFEDHPWEKYAHFAHLYKVGDDSRDQCMAVSSYMVTVADFNGNKNFKFDQCEWLATCGASLHEEGDSEEDEFNKAKKCVKEITKACKVLKKKSFTMGDIGQHCADQFPTLEGSPLPYEDEKILLVEKTVLN